MAFNVINNLRIDVIIGKKIFQDHKKVVFSFDRNHLASMLIALCQMAVPYQCLFSHLAKSCLLICSHMIYFLLKIYITVDLLAL